jgi:hypothetical protein
MNEIRTTRQEITGKRPLEVSKWIRRKMPDSKTGYWVSDLDFILYNVKTKKLMFLEVKTRNSPPKWFQKTMWKSIHNWIRKGIDDDWTYLGFNLITFENTVFNDGRCFLNGKEISELELKEFLSF